MSVGWQALWGLPECNLKPATYVEGKGRLKRDRCIGDRFNNQGNLHRRLVSDGCKMRSLPSPARVLKGYVQMVSMPLLKVRSMGQLLGVGKAGRTHVQSQGRGWERLIAAVSPPVNLRLCPLNDPHLRHQEAVIYKEIKMGTNI